MLAFGHVSHDAPRLAQPGRVDHAAGRAAGADLFRDDFSRFPNGSLSDRTVVRRAWHYFDTDVRGLLFRRDGETIASIEEDRAVLS